MNPVKGIGGFFLSIAHGLNRGLWKEKKPVKPFAFFLLLFPTLCVNPCLPPPVAIPEPSGDMSQYPQHYFAPPLHLPLTLAGNFGEPRKGHFHTGLDFRTNSEEGYPVLASANGYVSRINVSPYGYGNALFITHPNGYTTVYGHLREFAPALMERLRKEQYAKKEFAEDIFPKADEFPVKQGDTIAFSGSSGGAAGPHLHFEIRDAYERPLNPLLFGFKMEDEKHIVVKELKIYAMDSLKYSAPGVVVKLNQKDSTYGISGESLKVNVRQVGVAANVYDWINLTGNYIGIYNIRLFDEGKLIYEYRINRLAFSETRNVLSQLDYPEFLSNHLNMYHRCFVEPGNKCPVYSNLINRGIVDLSDGKLHKIKIEVSDFTGHTSTIRFGLVHDAKSTTFKAVGLKYLTAFYPDKENQYSNPELTIKIPPNCLFDTVYFNCSSSPNTNSGIFSKIYAVDRSATQAFQWFEISLKTEGLSAALRDKAVMVYRDTKGEEVSRGGKYENGFVAAKGREFGTYYIKIDTIPPVITPVNMPGLKNAKPKQNWTFKITDNLSGIEGFDTYLDGKWVETDYDAKNDLLIHTPEAGLAAGNHIFKVVVRDERNNVAQYSSTFKW